MSAIAKSLAFPPRLSVPPCRKGVNAVFAAGGNGVERTLRRRDGVSASAVGVPLPGSAVLDADAVHLPGGVVPAAQAAAGVAQVFQQVRHICPLGSLRLLVCKTKGCILFRNVVHLLLPAKRKETPRAS